MNAVGPGKGRAQLASLVSAGPAPPAPPPEAQLGPEGCQILWNWASELSLKPHWASWDEGAGIHTILWLCAVHCEEINDTGGEVQGHQCLCSQYTHTVAITIAGSGHATAEDDKVVSAKGEMPCEPGAPAEPGARWITQ